MDPAKEAETIKKFGIDIESLKREQSNLAKNITLKDETEFNNIEFIGSFSNIIIGSKILSAVVVTDKAFNIVDEKFFIDRVNFPYLAEFRSYRELPAMLKALEQLEQKPELFLIDGLGINHPRLGEASHFSINTDIPSIAITDNSIGFNISDDKLFINDKEVGRVIQTKQGSKPLFVSPGSGVSIETAVKIVKDLVRPPHKLPEVMKLARKYAKKIHGELFKNNQS
ncbi:endonuclease V [Candidatus Pacearchaeota archaeon]|nr:endonuclease V [Candidatus Pacearchaeota archaeon]